MTKLLVVDDSKVMHSYLEEMSKGQDIIIEHAFNGEEAINKIKAMSTPPTVIFLDWEMPVLNGPDTFKKLKEMGSKIPVIMMTSKNAPEDIMMMMKNGVREYMMKPFTKDIFLEKLNFVLAEAG